jgi:hypothetical protein
MSTAFDKGGEEKVVMAARVLAFGMPVNTEVWVGSCKVLSPALGRGEGIRNIATRLVRMNHHGDLRIRNDKRGHQLGNVLRVSSTNVRKVVVRSTKAK